MPKVDEGETLVGNMSEKNQNELKVRVERLRKQGMSLSEANRVVFGWSDPMMPDFWEVLWKDRPSNSPAFSQKDAFFLVMKTSFGSDYVENKAFELAKSAFDEICMVVVKGIEAGQVVKRSLKNKSLSDDKLFHDARSEFQRLIKEDPLFKRVQREE